MNTRRPTPRARGLSLIELLVAVAIGGILMGGAITLFINNRATYEVTNDMARLQESARFAMQLMSQDIRMAGYVGCVNDVTKVNDNLGLAEGQLANFTHAIEGYEAGDAAWSPSGHLGENKAVIAGGAGFNAFEDDSDGITVRYFMGNMQRTGGDIDNEVVNASPDDANPTNPVIQVRNLTHTLVDGQAAAISDCGGADLFALDAAPGTAGGVDTVTASALNRSYEALNRAIVTPFMAVRYFVRPNGANVPALFRSTLNPGNVAQEDTVELVDGVQSLQLLYGVDANLDGIPDEFLSAGQISAIDPNIKLTSRNDYLSVVAVRISLLLGTVDEFGGGPDNNVYDVGAERFCRTGLVAVPACTRTYAPDQRRRRVFQTTVAVRNFQ
jgi:type IV pilus assembly protein PilW